MSEWIQTLGGEAQALIAVTVIWFGGFLMTRATKAFGLPNVTGYILAGVVIGPYCLDLIPQPVSQAMSFITDAALALIAFGVGRYLSLDRLRGQGVRVILLTLMESLTAAVVVTVVMLTVFRLPLSFSLLLGAIASATAPASSLMTIRQYRAKGAFVNTLIQVVALDDAVSLLAFSLCAAIAVQSEIPNASWREALIPVGINIAVLLVCYLLGRLLVTILRGRSQDHRIVLTCAFIFLIAGGCAAVDISPLLGCMVLGATYINLSHDKTLFKQVGRISPPINMMFFVLSGMRLNLGALSTVGVIGVTYFAVRILGKYGGAWLGARLTHMPDSVQKYLGLALIPQAGVSIGLAVLAQRILPAETGTLLSTIILSSSVLYEMIGPVCGKRALTLAGVLQVDAQGKPLPPAPAPAPEKPVKGKKQPPEERPAKPSKSEEKAAKSEEKSAKLSKSEEKTVRPSKSEEKPARPEEKPAKPARSEEKADEKNKAKNGKKHKEPPAPPPPDPEPEPAPEPEKPLRRLFRRVQR